METGGRCYCVNVYINIWKDLDGMYHFGRPTDGLQDDIKMDLKNIDDVVFDSIHL